MQIGRLQKVGPIRRCDICGYEEPRTGISGAKCSECEYADLLMGYLANEFVTYAIASNAMVIYLDE